MAYDPINFKDGSTPLDASNFNKMDAQIAANADMIDSLNNDLANRFASINSGSIFDLKESGVYFIRTQVADRPANAPGLYILGYYSASYNVGVFIPCYDEALSTNNRPYVQINGAWFYSLSVTAYSATSVLNIKD